MSLSLVAADYHSDPDPDEEQEQEQEHAASIPRARPTAAGEGAVHHRPPVWSICLDPNTGCPYYWEQNSNRVSWEPPPGYNDTPSGPLSKAKTPNSVASRRNISNHNHSQTPLFPISEVTEKRVPSDDDEEEEPEEKIELITSFYNCDSASDEEGKPKTAEVPAKSILKVKLKPRAPPEKIKEDKDPVLYGPQLPEEIERALFTDNKKSDKSKELDAEIDKEGTTDCVPASEHSQLKSVNPQSKLDLEDIISKIEQEQPIDLPASENSALSEENNESDQSAAKSPPQTSKPEDENIDEVEKKRKLVFGNYSSKCFKREDQALSESKTYDITYTTKYSETFEISGERVGLGFSKLHEDEETDKKTGTIIFEKGETIIPQNEVISKSQLLKDQEILNAKLKYLTSIISPVPVVHKLFIEMKVLWAAYEAGELSTKYINDQMSDLVQCLVQQEEQAVSPPWIYRYHSDLECYMYENSETGECQKEHPSEQDMDICCTPPPLPSSSYSPPPPPSLSPDRLQSDEYNDCSKDLNSEGTSKPNEKNLVAALDSFYSDIAALDTKVDAKSEKSKREAFPTEKSHRNEKNVETPTNCSQIKDNKKKFKSNTTGLKNKSMSSLVEKWKKVQESL